MKYFFRLWRLEMRRLARGSRTRWVLVTVALLGMMSAAISNAWMFRYAQAGQRDEQASSSVRRAKVVAEIPPSPLDLTLWSDSLIARKPMPAEVWTAGDLVEISGSAAVRISEAPRLIPSTAQRSPAATLMGFADWMWFLLVVLPLAAMMRGYDIIAGDRVRGMLAMLLVSTPRPAGLVWARILALGLILWLATLPGWFLGMLLPLVFTGEVGLMTGLSVVMLTGAYGLLLAALTVFASSVAKNPTTALVYLLFGWAWFAVGVPMGMNGLSHLAYPDPDPRIRLTGVQAAAEVFAKEAPMAVALETAADPKLDPETAANGVESQARYDLLLARAHHRRHRGALVAEQRQAFHRAELMELAGYGSPMVFAALALARQAQTSPVLRHSFNKSAANYRNDLWTFAQEEVLAGRMETTTLKRWPKTPGREPLKSYRLESIKFTFMLVVFTIVFATLATHVLKREGRSIR